MYNEGQRTDSGRGDGQSVVLTRQQAEDLNTIGSHQEGDESYKTTRAYERVYGSGLRRSSGGDD